VRLRLRGVLKRKSLGRPQNRLISGEELQGFSKRGSTLVISVIGACSEQLKQNMKELLKQLKIAALIGVAGFLFTACQKGPMEEAGESIDDAVEDVKDAFD
jgi:hypothetical protein